MKFSNRKQRMVRDRYEYVIESATILSKRDKCNVVVLEKEDDVIYTPVIYDAHRLIDNGWSIFCILQDGKEV